MKYSDKSVVVGLSGGLGNQLFQYAAGRSLSLKLGVGLVLDASWFQGYSDRAYGLDAFAIRAKIYSGSIFLPGWINRLGCRLTRKWAHKKFGVPIYREPHFQFDEMYSQLEHPVYLEGFWQSERYFLSHKEIISDDLKLKAAVSDRFKVIANQIQSSNSICVHIRRGDYVINSVASQMHGLCSLDYIYQGVRKVSKDLAQPYCFIFSDEPEWARNNLKLDIPFLVVDVAKPDEAYIDLVLMSQCKHFVIANSSFSWWAAWLSDSPLKRVVAPKKWFVSSEKCIDDLIPNSWMKL